MVIIPLYIVLCIIQCWSERNHLLGLAHNHQLSLKLLVLVDLVTTYRNGEEYKQQ